MLFDINSAVIKLETQAAVELTGGALRSVDIWNIRVEGHADNTASDSLDLDLSQRRAQMVAAALDKTGRTGNITPLGFGKTCPISDNATEAGRAQNRRVSVVAIDSRN